MSQASTDESDQPHTDFSLVTGRFPFFREEKKKFLEVHPGHLSEKLLLV